MANLLVVNIRIVALILSRFKYEEKNALDFGLSDGYTRVAEHEYHDKDIPGRNLKTYLAEIHTCDGPTKPPMGLYENAIPSRVAERKRR